jgi:hypothetical protein
VEYSSASILGGAEGVGKQKCNGHGTDASRVGCNRSGNCLYGRKINIADQAIPSGRTGVGDAVYADIDYGGTGFDVLLGQEKGAAQGTDQDVALPGDRGEIGSAGVGKSDGAVGVGGFTREENGERSAHDLAATDDHGVFSLGWNFSEAENFENSCWGAGKKPSGISQKKFSEVHWMKSVDIFGGRDTGVDLIVGECRGKGGLDEDSVNFWIGIEGVDFG